MCVFRWVGAAALAAVVLVSSGTAAELPPASQWMPGGALAAIEVSNAEDVLDLLLGDELLAAAAALPVWQQEEQAAGLAQFQQTVSYFEAHLGTDWKTATRKLLGGGATLALYPDQSVLLVIDGTDAALLERFRDFATTIAKGEAAKTGNPDRIRSSDYRGVTGWTFGAQEAHAVLGSRLIVSNRVERLKSVIDLRADGGGTLADQSQYRAAKATAGPQADALLMVDLGLLKQAPNVRQTLDKPGHPMADLLLAGVADSLRAAQVVTLAADVEGHAVRLTAAGDGKAAAARGAAAFTPTADGSVLPNLRVPGYIAGFSFCRDLHGFYAAKDELFPERTGGLIFFENMMGIFFSGRDLTDEVLAELGPKIRLVVAQQAYDEANGVPATQFPAVAAVLRMQKDPQKFSIVMEEAWQKAIGLVNFTRGQQAEPGLIIDRPTHGDTRFTVARFAAPKVEERSDADVRFNFSPALAMPDGYLILSSTEGLARDLIDALKQEASETLDGIEEVHSLVEVDGTSLAAVLRANREPLVRKNMLEEGHSREQAETAIASLVAIVGQFRQVGLELRGLAGATQARLSIELKLDEKQAP